MKNNDEVNKLSIQSTLCSVQFDVCRAITSQNHSQCFFHEYSSESCSTCMAWPNVFLFSSTFCEIQHEMFAYNILSSCRGHWSSKSVCHFIWMAFALNQMLLKMTWTDEIPHTSHETSLFYRLRVTGHTTVTADLWLVHLNTSGKGSTSLSVLSSNKSIFIATLVPWWWLLLQTNHGGLWRQRKEGSSWRGRQSA